MKKLTITHVRRLVESQGGILEKDGVGGWDALAPAGCRWAEAEVSCYPLPLSECESADERQDLLRQAMQMLNGVEPSGACA